MTMDTKEYEEDAAMDCESVISNIPTMLSTQIGDRYGFNYVSF